MNTFKRIAKNSLFQTIALVVRAVSAFFVSIILARVAGAELLGDYAAVITLLGLFAFISGYGLPELLTRELARKRDDREQVTHIVNVSLTIVVVFSLIAIILLGLTGKLVMHYPATLVWAVIMGGVALGLESIANVIAAAFRGAEEMERSSAVAIVMEVVLFLGIVLVSLLLHPSIIGLLAAYILSRMISLGVAIRLFWVRFGHLHPVINKKTLLVLLRQGFPFSINDVWSVVYTRVDVVMLSFFSGDIVVGIYEAATSLSIRVNIIAWTLNLALYPHMSRQYELNEQSVWKNTANSIKVLLLPGALITTLLWAFGREIILLLYGQSFLDAVRALQLFALLIPIRLAGNSFVTAMKASNRQTKRATAVVIAGIFNVVVNFFVIPRYAMMGAVYSTILTEFLLLGMSLWYLRDHIAEIINWRDYLAPALGSLAVVVLVLLMNLNFWLLGVLAVLLYGVIILVIEPSLLVQLRKSLAKSSE